jgi:hypothetical protein
MGMQWSVMADHERSKAIYLMIQVTTVNQNHHLLTDKSLFTDNTLEESLKSI